MEEMKEEMKDDIIYDLEAPVSETAPVPMETTEPAEVPEPSEAAKVSEEPEEAPTDSDPHEAELQRLVSEMGAETVLEIIRDNRNAAIRQIISEVEAARPRGLPSGTKISSGCGSIFDLAALA